MASTNKIVIPKRAESNISGGWRQPEPESIHVFDRGVAMSKTDFLTLYEYSTTNPTGIYVGKMWRCRISTNNWALKYVEPGNKQGYVRIKQVPIIAMWNIKGNRP